MRCIVINLPLAWERREAVEHEFRKVGLDYELWPAVSGFDLTDDIKGSVDHATRGRLGMRRLDDFSVACLLSRMAVLRELVNGTDDMVAVFDDDARLHPDLPNVLDALEGKADKFDVVKLQRRDTRPSYYPVYQLLRSHSLGRLKYHDRSADGYVITRDAAARLLELFPHPVHETDMIMPRFWENGLRRRVRGLERQDYVPYCTSLLRWPAGSWEGPCFGLGRGCSVGGGSGISYRYRGLSL